MKNNTDCNVSVRRALLKDAEALARLNQLFNGIKITAQSIRNSLKRKGTETIFVAELDGEVIGFASVQITSTFSSKRKTAELTDIFVEETGRRNGVGSHLLLMLRKHCEKQNVSEFFLRVNRTNDGAIAFYESHGLIDAEHREFRIRYG